MSDWQPTAMAISLVIMATIQLGLIAAAIMVGLQVTKALREIRRELGPLMVKVQRIADNAERTSALAASQVERVDQLVSNVCERVEETIAVIQGAIIEPVRQTSAIIAAIKAAFSVFRDWRGRNTSGRDEEDPMFVG